MAGISEIVSVTITATTRNPTRAGFGTILLMGYHTRFSERLRVYTGIEGAESDGFSATTANGSQIHAMLTAAFAQDPRPPRVKVGRLLSAPTQTKTLTVTSNTAGDHVKVTVTTPAGVEWAIDYTIPAAQTLTQVATAVAALINALTGVDATGSVAVMTVVPTTAGQVFFLRDFLNCDVKDITAAGTYVADLTSLQLTDDDWYFVNLDINSNTIATAVNAWTETRIKEMVLQTQDSGELDGTGTYGSGIKALNYERSQGIFTAREDQYPAVAWSAVVATKDPGGITWRFKLLRGVVATLFNATQETNLRAAGWNFYTTVAGLDMVLDGVTFAGEYPDVRHGTDWLGARIQERILGLLANADKWPFEDSTVDTFTNEIESVLLIGENKKFLAKGTSTCTGPKVLDIDPAVRAARILPDIVFGARLASAVHKAEIRGTLSI